MRFNTELYRLTTARQFAQPATVIDLLDQSQVSEAIAHRLLLDGLKPTTAPKLTSAGEILQHVHALTTTQCLQLSKAVGAHKLAREFTQQLRSVIQQNWEDLDNLEGPLAKAKEAVTPTTITDQEWDEYSKLCKQFGFKPNQTKYTTDPTIKKEAEIGVYQGMLGNLTEVCNYYNKLKLELTAYQERAQLHGAPEAAQLTDKGILGDGEDPVGSMRSFMLNEATGITTRVEKFLATTGKSNLNQLSPEEWAKSLETEFKSPTKQWSLSLAHLIYYDDACAPKPLTEGGMAFKRYLYLTGSLRHIAEAKQVQTHNLLTAQAGIVSKVIDRNTDPLKRWDEFKSLGETQHLAQCAALRDFLDTTPATTKITDNFRNALMDHLEKHLPIPPPNIS